MGSRMAGNFEEGSMRARTTQRLPSSEPVSISSNRVRLTLTRVSRRGLGVRERFSFSA